MSLALPITIAIFQPTLPVRGATRASGNNGDVVEPISTHAPRAGSDTIWNAALPAIWAFQPTLPVRGATSKNQFFRI